MKVHHQAQWPSATLMLTLALTLLLTFYSSPAAAIHATDERRVQVHGHQNRQQRRKQQSLRSVEAFQLDAGSDADEGWFERYSVCNKRISKNFLSRKYQGKSEANCQACLTGDGACAYVVNGDRAACRLKHKLNTAQARAGAGGTFVGSPLCCHNIMQKTPQQNTQCSQRQEAVHVLQRTQLMGLANPRKSAPDLVAAAIDAAKKNIPTDQGARRTFEDALAATVTFTGLTLSKGGSSLEAIRAIEAGSQIAGVLEQTAQATEVAVPVVGVVLGFVTDGLALARGKSYLQLVEDTLQQLKTAATTMSSERGNARAVAHVEMPVTLEAAMDIDMPFAALFEVWEHAAAKAERKITRTKIKVGLDIGLAGCVAVGLACPPAGLVTGPAAAILAVGKTAFTAYRATRAGVRRLQGKLGAQRAADADDIIDVLITYVVGRVRKQWYMSRLASGALFTTLSTLGLLEREVPALVKTVAGNVAVNTPQASAVRDPRMALTQARRTAVESAPYGLLKAAIAKALTYKGHGAVMGAPLAAPRIGGT